jgi:endonuclease III
VQSATILPIVTILVAVAGFVITHMLSQRAGEKRANQVRDELVGKLTTVEQSLVRNVEALDKRIDDFKVEAKDRISDIQVSVSELNTSVSEDIAALRADIVRSKEDLKELFRSEVRAAVAELRIVMTEKMRRANDSDT